MRVQHNWFRLPLGSTLGMEIRILIPSGGLKQLLNFKHLEDRGFNLLKYRLFDH